MPTLGSQSTTRFWLPSSAGEAEEINRGYVELKEKLNLGDLMALQDCKTDAERGIVLLTRLIKDWNFTVDGTPTSEKLPIIGKNIEEFQPQDFIALTEWVNENIADSLTGLTDDEKKTSSSTSIPVTEPLQPTS
jgi:hypothetical protein